MGSAAFDKFLDLKKKATFWLEITQTLPQMCPTDCWTKCFEKSFSAHEKLWNFQQNNRKILDDEPSFKRELIGDIAWNIASTYMHYHIRFISSDFLKRSLMFFEAIVDRGYFGQIKETDKYRQFLLCYSVCLLLANKIKESRDIIKQIIELDHPTDSSQSFILSQSSVILNDIEIIFQLSCFGKLFERGASYDCIKSENSSGHSSSSFLSISETSKNLYGELTISNVLLSGLLSNLSAKMSQYFIKNTNYNDVMNAIFHAISNNCTNPKNILIVHVDAPVMKSLSGDDIFYLGNSTSDQFDEESIFRLSDFNCARRKIILISEYSFRISDLINESVFVFVPLKSSMWPHNPTLLLYSVEFLFYEYYSKSPNRGEHRGKIENFTRISAQSYSKFISKLIADVFSNTAMKYSWILECPVGFVLLHNYIMSYYFLSWMEFNQKNTYLDCPISKLLTLNLTTAHKGIYKFLESLTGT